jgi:membrane protein DedA with SNARE-associated domain
MTIDQAGTYSLAGRDVKRLGYGAMQLAGPGVFGPPRDHNAAIAVLRAAVAAGVNHIDTSDFYGPHVTNRLIREALSPYPDDLLIVTKIGSWRTMAGVVIGTACAWLGMTAGAMLGWWLGHTAGAASLSSLTLAEQERLARQQSRFGPLAVVLTRPLPLVAEAAAIMAGASGMRWQDFLIAAGSGNLAIALVWSLAGALGRQADSLQWVAIAAVAVPAVVAALVAVRRHDAGRISVR